MRKRGPVGLRHVLTKGGQGQRRPWRGAMGCLDPPAGRVSAPSGSHSKSVLYGAFVWARRALNSQTRRFRSGQRGGGSGPDEIRAGGGGGGEGRAVLCRLRRRAPRRGLHRLQGPGRTSAEPAAAAAAAGGRAVLCRLRRRAPRRGPHRLQGPGRTSAEPAAAAAAAGGRAVLCHKNQKTRADVLCSQRPPTHTHTCEWLGPLHRGRSRLGH